MSGPAGTTRGDTLPGDVIRGDASRGDTTRGDQSRGNATRRGTVPGDSTRTGAVSTDAILEVRGLKKYFPVYGGLLRRHVADVKAVDGVSFAVREGETLGLVGESGCGKTTVGRSIVRLIEPTSGEILLRTGAPGDPGGAVDVTKLPQKQLKAVRRQVQMIFQDPNSSLNPRMTVREILREPFVIHKTGGSKAEVEERIAFLLEAVGLSPDYRNRYPHQFSGGQRQRIGIARALALQPKLIVADEPVSALDVSVQGQVLNLLQDLQEKFKLTYLFIAHDLAVVAHISDRVAVMYLGKIVELAGSDELYANPKHPYTEALLSAVPVPDPDARRERIVLPGSVPSPLNPPAGCRFHTRCPYAKLQGRMAKCASHTPELRPIGPSHWVACHFAEELKLRGVDPATSGA